MSARGWPSTDHLCVSPLYLFVEVLFRVDRIDIGKATAGDDNDDALIFFVFTWNHTSFTVGVFFPKAVAAIHGIKTRGWSMKGDCLCHA